MAAALLGWGFFERSRALASFDREPKSGESQNGNTGIVLGIAVPLGIIGAICASVFWPDDQIVSGSWLLVGIGMSGVASGVALRRWALRTLGEWFSGVIRVQEGQPVLRNGPYRLIRHPAYAGPVLSAVGFGLGLGTWLSLAIAIVCFFAGYSWRIRHEEAVLVSELGDDYAVYQTTTRRLGPWVW
jgi:protein-S-isoprenylcysteine O-methyltransferase